MESQLQMRKLIVGYRNMNRVEISECVFADDVAIMTRTEEGIQSNINI